MNLDDIGITDTDTIGTALLKARCAGLNSAQELEDTVMKILGSRSMTICSVSPAEIGAIGDNPATQRLFDLVRYMRGELLEANLISNGEYATLVSGGGNPPNRSVARLEGYDAVKATLGSEVSKLQRQLKMADDQIREARSGGHNLYSAIVAAIAKDYPKNSMALEWDVLPSTLGEMARKLRHAERRLEEYKEAVEKRLHYDMNEILTDTPENLARKRTWNNAVTSCEAALDNSAVVMTSQTGGPSFVQDVMMDAKKLLAAVKLP